MRQKRPEYVGKWPRNSVMRQKMKRFTGTMPSRKKTLMSYCNAIW